MIELTARCNRRCSICYENPKRGSGVGRNADKRKDIDLNVVRSTLEYFDSKNIYYLVTGGEPTIHPHFESFIQLMKGRPFTLFTNGSEVEEGVLDKLSESDVRLVNVSLHGIGAIHDRITRVRGSYKSALHMIEKMKRSMDDRCDISLYFTINRDNYSQVTDAYDIAMDMGVDLTICHLQYLSAYDAEAHKSWCHQHLDIHFSRWTADPLLPDEVDELYEAIKIIREKSRGSVCTNENPRIMNKREMHNYYSGGVSYRMKICPFALHGIYIKSDGTVMSCFPCRIPYSHGNIHESSMDYIMKGDKRVRYLKVMKSEGFAPGCKTCCILN